MPDFRLSECLEELCHKLDEDKARNKQQQSTAFGQERRRRALITKCDALASFSQDRVVVIGNRDPRPHLYYQWASSWKDFAKWLRTAGFAERLGLIKAEEDTLLATVLDWLSAAQRNRGVAELEECLEKAAEKPELLRSILEALRKLPSILLPPEEKAELLAGERANPPCEIAPPAANRTSDPGRQRKDANTKMMAIAFRISNPGWSDEKVAKAAGVSRTSLYRWDDYMKAKERMGMDKARLPRGRKNKDGTVEAYWERAKDEDG